MLTYVGFVALQFTIYENLMQSYKKKYGEEKMKKNEMYVNLGSSLFAGSLAAAVTNPLECITVNKQITPGFKIKEFI